MLLLTGMNLITPSVSISPYTFIVGVMGEVVEPEIMIDPDKSVLPKRVLFPICVVEPDIFKDPVRVVVPIRVLEPVVNRLPVTVWSPIKMFDPVVARDALFATNTGSVSK
jgi:hypothetical protein